MMKDKSPLVGWACATSANETDKGAYIAATVAAPMKSPERYSSRYLEIHPMHGNKEVVSRVIVYLLLFALFPSVELFADGAALKV